MQRYWASKRAWIWSPCASYWEKFLLGLLGEPAVPFLSKYIVPAANRVGVDLLEFAVPEVVDVVSGKKNFKTAAKSLGRQIFRKQLGGGKQKRNIPVKRLKRSSWSRREFLLIFQINIDRFK